MSPEVLETLPKSHFGDRLSALAAMPPRKRSRAVLEKEASAALAKARAVVEGVLRVAANQVATANSAAAGNALLRRFTASALALQRAGDEWIPGLNGAARKAGFDCGALASCAEKALEAGAEEARVAAAQLQAYAALLEWEAEDGEECCVGSVARALLSYSPEAAGAPRFVGVMWDSVAAWRVVDASMRLRDGIDPYRCTVSGSGLTVYLAGDQAGDNGVSVRAVDGEGEAVESIEAEDVCVRLSVEGASVTHVGVREAGVVEVVYRVPEGSVALMVLSVSVCGAMLAGSPWSVVCPLWDSAILASVAPERVAAFLRELSAWLPRRAYTLLYRGSRDGMTAAAFHRLCDGKGPTLVLVQSEKGWVFGGHAGASWESPPSSIPQTVGTVTGDEFVLSVTGPYTTAPVRFPVRATSAGSALYCYAGCGPCFNGGLYVRAGSDSPTASFDGGSFCQIGYYYEDSIGRRGASLTGARDFNPVEVEVCAMTHV